MEDMGPLGRLAAAVFYYQVIETYAADGLDKGGVCAGKSEGADGSSCVCWHHIMAARQTPRTHARTDVLWSLPVRTLNLSFLELLFCFLQCGVGGTKLENHHHHAAAYETKTTSIISSIDHNSRIIIIF